MLEQVAQAAVAAAEVEAQERSAGRPARTERPGDHAVELGGGDHTVTDEGDGLAEQRRLQPVADEAVHLLVDLDRVLADRAQELRGPRDAVARGALPGDELHQRQDVRRVERVRDEQPGCGVVVEPGGDVGGQDPRGGAEQQRTGGGVRGRGRPDVLLHLQALGSLLLDDVGTGHGAGEVRFADDPLQQVRRPEPAHTGVDDLGQVRPRVGDDDVVSGRGQQHGPGDADGAGTDLGDPHDSSR
ncbi:hypothetical protein WY02_01420 [Pseudonocardia sp. AL041005-10]|nr:hypothetical protein WY02_01420 [Pseudonocardia sp. AL041005-10]